MHIGIHYPKQAEEYGVTNNSMVLAGESKHRYETVYSFFQSHFASWITWLILENFLLEYIRIMFNAQINTK